MADAAYEIRQALLAAHDLQDWLNSRRYSEVWQYSYLEKAIMPAYKQLRETIKRLDLALIKAEDKRCCGTIGSDGKLYLGGRVWD